MDIKQKAKAYDEALKEAVIAHKDEDRHLKATLERIFPELKESKDEKIRKNIKIALMSVEEELADFYSTHHTSQEEFLDWLEKQGESYTKRDVDNAYLEGMAFAKDELEKQGEQNLANSAKTCKKPQRMVSAEAKEALYDKSATIDIDKMVDDYANNEEFGKPLNSMIRAYRQGLKDAIWKGVSESAWTKEDEEMLDGIILRCEKYGHQEQINWLKSLKQRIGG